MDSPINYFPFKDERKEVEENHRIKEKKLTEEINTLKKSNFDSSEEVKFLILKLKKL